MSVASLAVTGFDSFRRKIDRYSKDTQARIKLVLRKGALAIQKDAILEIAHGEKTGETYGNHQASAPGEAPATDTGELVSGIRVELAKDGMEAQVQSKAKHSMPLEFGTRYMAARPFLGPSYRKNLPQITLDYRAAAKWRAGK